MESPSPMCSETPGMREMRHSDDQTWIPKLWLRRRICARNGQFLLTPKITPATLSHLPGSGSWESGNTNPFTNSNLHYYGSLHSAGYPLAELRLKALRGYSLCLA